MVQFIDDSFYGVNDKIKAGIAIAAPQIGFMKKVIYVHFEYLDKEYKYLLANPKVVSESRVVSYLKGGEGCLSVDDKHEGLVPRKLKIVVKGYDLLDNKEVQINADGILSICLQHEIDHLSGIMFYDHINKQDP